MVSTAPKKKAKAKRLTPEERHARFVEAAEEVEADEEPGALNRAIERLSVKMKVHTTRKGRI